MGKLRTHYDHLQVARTASIDAIRGAYQSLSAKWDPDRNQQNRAEAERITRILEEAYAVLSDPLRREAHDRWIEEQERAGATASEGKKTASSEKTEEGHAFFEALEATTEELKKHLLIWRTAWLPTFAVWFVLVVLLNRPGFRGGQLV